MEYLPTIFYILGIIYFIVWLGVMIFLAILAWKTYQYIRRAPHEIQEHIEEKVKNILPAFVVPFVLGRIRNFFNRKNH